MGFFTFNTNPPKCECLAEPFSMQKPSVDLYDRTARELAEDLATPQVLVEKKRRGHREWVVRHEDKANKPTQIRKFYDELCMWEQKARDADTFASLLPFIKMMNAKVAYARGRDLVDDQFVAWFSTCMEQIRDPNENGLMMFRNFRTHFEAFLGFFKQARPN
jgi:CRISPR-associated protein Csm2